MKLIVGNWKMFPPKLVDAKEIFRGIKKGVKGASRTKVVICPPALYIAPLVSLRGKSALAIGGQNSFKDDEGARTGEVSPRWTH